MKSEINTVTIGKNKKRYLNIVAENYFCVPTVLEIILISEGIDSINRFDIAEYLGVTLPLNSSCSYVSNIRYSDNPKSLGVVLKSNSINDFFRDKHIPLLENYISISQYERDFFSDVINFYLLKGNHIVCGFEYNSLYKIPSQDRVGHVSIILDYDNQKEEITLLDPGPKNYGIKSVNVYDLYRAIALAGDGLWIISRTIDK